MRQSGARRQQLGETRSLGSDIVLEDETASRRHAELLWRAGGWVVRDLGSRNGTRLNGRPAMRAQLRPGGLIQFGESAFRVD